jgi:hypothetical protein
MRTANGLEQSVSCRAEPTQPYFRTKRLRFAARRHFFTPVSLRLLESAVFSADLDYVASFIENENHSIT